jgi:hypothetical protein
MNYSSPELEITDRFETCPDCLYFKFKNKFTETASIAGAKFWNSICDGHPDQNYSIIWDTTEMSGFEIKARTEWYSTMKRNKHQIQNITVISSSVIIRSAARVMLEFFNVKYRMLRNIEELQFQEA